MNRFAIDFCKQLGLKDVTKLTMEVTPEETRVTVEMVCPALLIDADGKLATMIKEYELVEKKR